MGWLFLWWAILLLPALLAVPYLLLVLLVFFGGLGLMVLFWFVKALSLPEPAPAPLGSSLQRRMPETGASAWLPETETQPAQAAISPAQRSFAETMGQFERALRKRLAQLDSYYDSLSPEHTTERQEIIETLERFGRGEVLPPRGDAASAPENDG